MLSVFKVHIGKLQRGSAARNCLAGLIVGAMTLPALAHAAIETSNYEWNKSALSQHWEAGQERGSGWRAMTLDGDGPTRFGQTSLGFDLLNEILNSFSPRNSNWDDRNWGEQNTSPRHAHDDRWSPDSSRFNPWFFGRYFGRDNLTVVVFLGDEFFGRGWHDHGHHHGGGDTDHGDHGHSGNGGDGGWKPPHFDPDSGEHAHCGGDGELPEPVPLPAALPLAISGLAALRITAWRTKRSQKIASA